MLASLLLCSVHIPHEAPDSRSSFVDFVSDESACPRRDFVADTITVVGAATSGVITDSSADTISGVDTDS
jgi:hypothetical protein